MQKHLASIITLFFMAVVHVPLHAQYFKGGMIAGVNGSQITGDNMVGFNKGGILGGVFIEHNFTDYLYLRMEMVYTQKGSRKVVNESGTGPGLWNLMRINYFEIPFILNYNLEKVLEKYGIHNDRIILSPGLGFAVLAGEFQLDNYRTEIGEPDFANTFEGSLFLGAEYELNPKWKAFLRYQSSLYNMSTGKASPFWQFWGIRKKGYINVVTSIGFRYYLGKNLNL